MKTFYRRMLDGRQRYAHRIAWILAVIVIVGFIVGHAVPPLTHAIIDSQALNVIILFLLLDVSVALSDVVRSQRGIRVSRDQPADTDELMKRLSELSIRDADMLEYSAVTVEEIIRHLKNCGCRLRILVKHPDAVAKSQRFRILQSLDQYYNLILDDYEGKAEIRCYREPASLRGRRFGGSLINIGWYTPDVARPGLGVRGHTNPVITADLSTPEGENLLRMFNGLFDALWTSQTTESAREVLDRTDWNAPGAPS
jgi:hypothetical protein